MVGGGHALEDGVGVERRLDFGLHELALQPAREEAQHGDVLVLHDLTRGLRGRDSSSKVVWR